MVVQQQEDNAIYKLDVIIVHVTIPVVLQHVHNARDELETNDMAVQNVEFNSKVNTSIHMALQNVIDEVVHGEIANANFGLQLFENVIVAVVEFEQHFNENSSCAIPEMQPELVIVPELQQVDNNTLEAVE
ncbi:hypothetical protein TSUD_394270 [Trifolium subterraneum]|uniref:Uncharacterized protein n=1 Tax=Trifolium subterraneum TaxID=3900 RepID=A0A2Z6MQU6_TRISU|nr:hypothetical protein TSUD_394270 [Trifolium subterraneum]